jgi:nucleotide-binding universal stress UspA family protein
MEKIHKILAPTDLSELSCAGVRYALETARPAAAEAVVYHVIHPDELNLPRQGIYTDSLAKLLPQARRGFPAEFLDKNFTALIGTGIPYQRNVEKASEENADILVISTHGRTGLSRADETVESRQ